MLGTLPSQPGGLQLGRLPPLPGRKAPPLPPPQAGVADVAAVLPEGLVGWTVRKVSAGRRLCAPRSAGDAVL